MTILITGASRGIGRAVAMAFAGAGYNLVLSSRNEVALYRCMEEMQTRFPGINVRARAFDLMQADQPRKLGEWVLEQGQVPDVVVNNAGIFEPGSVHNEPEGVLEQQLQLNVVSAYHLTRSLLPAMQQKRAGHIFNICSIASLKAYPNGGSYSISKFAMYGFSQNLREEMKAFNIKVTSVLPGAVLTDSWSGFDNRDNRIMEADDVASMMLAATRLSPGACVEEILLRPQLGDL